ncbi:MAG TPA: MerR family transcriptional regulator [Ktedonobacterales bacterium]|jgi:DNA-binding transcriptional MerR regulator|nr:MerR family transcriptional regulator [Ktedonobacterales bacterium]
MANVEEAGAVGLAADESVRRGRATGRGLTIGQVSQRTGIPAKTIRYYESVGLLPRPERGENHYRRYSHADVNRLLLLRRIKLLGAPLVEAKSLLASATDARCADAQEALLTLVDERLAALDQQIAELLALRTEIHDYRHTLESCQADEVTAFSDCADMRCIGAPPDGAFEEKENCCGDERQHELLPGSRLLPVS